MLVLSRKEAERIVIGAGRDAIVVTVASVEDGRVRLGVDAPKNVPVVRAELVESSAKLRPEGK